MELFIDSANLEDIKKAAELGVISGVTTNPTLIAKEGRNFQEVIMEITKLVDGPISAEVIGLTKDQMVKEARELVKIHPNIVIKIPMIAEGLKAIKELSKEGIKTNCTLIFSVNQAILAANAGATYVSPFVGRLEDIGEEGIGLVAKMAHVFEIYDYKTKIIAASIRNPKHVDQVAEVGADIATVPYKVIDAMMNHQLTDKGVDQFLKDWETVKDK
ncbi:transaldolase [Desulfonispora thiosulfatigenes DSM 11270]|uniref:Probable transaldolase n=1 Tax=Desulfonispora thiosulfatigenes DSM 11270 TaxID=656914 RepID=A0A1W1UYW6_DESTI|nr:fructose-6-phosphate aldolase [Desulfonispora thiosulfatigenes]SMB86298.1 transaldolase [Desulfonispora thiosulfatigenes DSM 11270]